MPVEVPAQVQYQDRVQNGVQVKAGTNWDLSRAAVETPIAPVVDIGPQRTNVNCACDALVGASPYKPADGLPSFDPVMTISFNKGSAALPAGALFEMRAFNRRSVVVVAGNADLNETGSKGLSQRRAAVVAEQLRKQGVRVEVTKSFGNTRYATTSPFKAELNRRVDIWAKP